jgi:hypothetical protein
MKLIKTCMAGMVMLALSTGTVSAQDSDSSDKYHPFLSAPFNIGLGVYRPSKKTVFSGDTEVGGGSTQATEYLSTGTLNFRWRFTKNWSFQGTYWETDSTSNYILDEPVTVTDPDTGEEIKFQAGADIALGLDTTIARLFWGRSFFRKPNHDFGVGAGLHWMELDFFVEGEASVDGAPTGPRRREEVSASVPLPNLGIWYMYSWSPKWVLATRLDWLDITIEEVSGSMYDASVGVNYQMSDNFGMGLAIIAFALDVNVKDGATKVGLEAEQIGPRLNITWNW